MNRIIITSVVISKGYDNKPALNFNDKRTCVRFKVGEKVYDKNADNNHRWINLNVKAFNPLVDRIEKMGLKEGSYVNIIGRLDEDVWEDEGTTKRMPVIILDEIEFSGGGNGNGGKKQEGNGTAALPEAPAGGETGTPADNGGNGQFTGFESFNGNGNDLY